MKFHPRLAPIKAAIFPLVNKDGMDERARELYRELKPFFNVVYDQSGAIGRRYRRQDEAGTPFCITVDGDTMKDGTVRVPVVKGTGSFKGAKGVLIIGEGTETAPNTYVLRLPHPIAPPGSA